MSDAIKHECGIALIRLRKPLSYFIEKYGTPLYAINKLYVLMQKQHNRGQDGAGFANIKVNVGPGHRYISRYRSVNPQPITDIFSRVGAKMEGAKNEGGERFFDADWLQENVAFTGEAWIGHLRYGTHGKNAIENCHPMLRMNNWRSRNLVVAGNFNLTNVEELFNLLVNIGQHPKEKTDTVTVMEKIGHFLDEENQMLFNKYKGRNTNAQITEIIENELDLGRVLKRACKDFDGGYAMAGLTGYGGGFVARDPNGIRPAYYYTDDEVIVVASEKPPIKTAFNVEYSEIKEIPAGHALIIKKNADFSIQPFIEQKERKSCSFERIYFSRGTDPDIYRERKMLGKLLVPQILKAIDFDLKNTVFSYIPNTAETAFYGMMDGLNEYLVKRRKEIIIENKPNLDSLEDLLSFTPRHEKLVSKDVKHRTFITDDDHRDELVAYVYDTTYEVIRKGVDTLVVLDDSIVRGTTLEKSILKMLDRLEPKRIIIVSSAPQIRFPDCYGIDMSKMKDFVAFRAVMALLKERGMEGKAEAILSRCEEALTAYNAPNHAKELYETFSDEEISTKIAEIIRPTDLQADLQVIYQTVENLHHACPDHPGDWYFTGDFPTPGGNAVANRAFVNFMKGITARAY